MSDFKVPDAQHILTELLVVLEHDEDFLKKFTLYTGIDIKTVEDALMKFEIRNTK